MSQIDPKLIARINELAKKKKKGLWQGKFMKPELWRRLQN